MAEGPPGWEYKVVQVNLSNEAPAQPPSAQSASQKLGGSLSPEFIAKEFPKVYPAKGSTQSPKPKSPAEQLQHFLNQLGAERWELVETTQVGPLLMFFFKRPKQRPAAPKPDVEEESKSKAS